jgi:hypothetical protein
MPSKLFHYGMAIFVIIRISLLPLFAKFQFINDTMENIILKKLSLDSLDLKISVDITNSWYVKIIEKVPELLSTHLIPENGMK